MSHKEKRNMGNVVEGTEVPVDVNIQDADAPETPVDQEKPVAAAPEEPKEKFGKKLLRGLKTAGKIAVVAVSGFGAVMGVKNAVSIHGLKSQMNSLNGPGAVPGLPGDTNSGALPGVPENPFNSHLDV